MMSLNYFMICLLCVALANTYEEDRYNDVFALPITYEVPDKAYGMETGGATVKIKVYSNELRKYIEYRVMIDTQDSAFWLVSGFCEFPDCKEKNKVTPEANYGACQLYFNKGNVAGIIDTKTLHLKSVVLENQPIYLVDNIDFPNFANSDIDGMMGLTMNNSQLHQKKQYYSIMKNVLGYLGKDGITAPVYLILKLGGKYPYMKIYFLEDFDIYHIRVNKEGKKETVYWINLMDSNKLTLALRYIKMKYVADGNILSEKMAVPHCMKTGCRALIDTKAYFIYGPANHLDFLKDIKSIGCKNLKALPHLEFSFFDIDPITEKSTSSIELTLTPDEYMFGITEEDCTPGILDHQTDYGWNLGIIFLRRFMVMYNFKVGQLGFVRVRKD